MLNSTGAVVGSQLYGPYGNKRYSTDTLPTSIGFTGQRTDSVTGLDYYVARYYDPAVGVFLSPDSVQGNAQGMQPYAYVGGNPETRTDPTGHRFICPNGCGSGGGGSTPPPPPVSGNGGGGPVCNSTTCRDGSGRSVPNPARPRQPVPTGGGGGGSTGTGKSTGTGTGKTLGDINPPTCDATCQAETQAYNAAAAAAAHFESIANMLNWSTNRQLNLIISAILTPFSWLVGGIVGGILTALSAWVDMAKTIAQGFRDELKYGVSWFTALNVIGDRTRILSNIGSGMFQELAGDVGVAIAGLLTTAVSGAVSDGLAVPVEIIGIN